MRKAILITLLIGISLSINAQNTFPSSGNVGIGTSNPSMKLQIVGSVSGHNNTLTLDDHEWFNFGNISGYGFINWFSQANINGDDFINTHSSVKASSIRGSSGEIRFYTSPINNGVGQLSGLYERMTIESNGNIGIGTANPNATLQVGDSDNSGSPSSEVEIKRLSLAPVTHSGSDWFFTTRDNTSYANLDIGYSNNKTLTLRHDGYVGIGADNPDSKLHIKNGNGNATLIVQGRQNQNAGNYAELV